MATGFDCPLFQTGYSGGVYYYYAIHCPGGTPVPAQDTRQHQTGISCTNCLDPIGGAGVPSAFSLVGGSELVNTGLTKGTTFEEPIFKTHGVLVNVKRDNTLALYKDKDGKERRARIWVFEVKKSDACPQDLQMMVGQELAKDAQVPANVVSENATLEAQDGCHHRIKLNSTGELFHVVVVAS